MKINHYLRIDLANPGLPPRLQVTQDDSGSHVVTIQLKEQGHPWFIPPDAAVLVHFRKSDRTGGVYDTLPNGSAAWDAVGNELQIILAPQVLTAPGETALAVTLIQGDNRLTVAKIVLQIAPCPGFAGISESYSYVSAFIPQPRSAAPGQLLQVKEVNELGVVLSTEAVNGGGSGIGSNAGKVLLSLLQKAVYTENVSAEMAQLEQQFGGDAPSPTVTLVSIDAVYTGTAVYAGTDVKVLQGVVVTAYYSDGSQQQVKNFSLSGVITQGENRITVSYGGCSDTITVVGIARPVDEYYIYNNLSFANNSNTATAVSPGSSYSCVITPQSGYELKRVMITMNGSTVFEENYTTSPLEAGWSTDNVTGDIIITAIAQAQVAMSRLSASYTGGSVQEGTKLSALTGITVTVHYTDGTTQQLTGGYGLYGTIGAGSNVITVSYGGLTTTFVVVGIAKPATLTLTHSWDFTQSMTDSIGGIVAQTNASQDSTGICFNASNQYINLLSTSDSILGKTIEIDIAPGQLNTPSAQHGRIFSIATTESMAHTHASCFTWRYNNTIGWASYAGDTAGGWDNSLDKTAYPLDFFCGRTIRLTFDDTGHPTLSYAETGSTEFITIHAWSIPWTYTTGNFVLGGIQNNELHPITFRAVRIYQEV